ncbi:MAG: molybdopterin molybdenumtransferase MoeA, partial [Candidatus Bathyarchaeia archaeon]
MARLKGFEKLTSVDEALRIYFETVKLKRLGAVMVPLHEALNRVVARDIIAEKDLPSFNRSAVDGYAVKAVDTVNATQFNPKTLQITSEETIHSGEAKTVWTGKPLPNG